MQNVRRELGPWYYEKYQCTKGMNRHVNSKLKNKLYYDHRTHTIPKTVIRNKIVDEILREENHVLGNTLLR